jgi:ENTS family enterobactin (siderophore) exporter
VSADLARMAGMGVLTLFLFVAGFSLPLILAVMILVNCFSALFTPASQAIVPALVATDSLEDANGLLLSSQGLGYSIGSATGGVMVVVLGAVWGLGINALTYALSAIFLLQIASELGRPQVRASSARTHFRQDLAEGIGYVVQRRPLLEVSFGYLPVNFLSSIVTPFMVVYATLRFGSDAAVFGALAAVLAAGNIVGSLGVGRLRIRHRAGWWMGITILVEAGGVALLAVSTNVGVSLVAVLAVGASFGIANTIYYATIQRIVPRELLGRVLSFGDFGSFVAIPAGLVAGGILLAAYGVESSFLLAAAGILGSGLVLLSLPGFRSFGERVLA